MAAITIGSRIAKSPYYGGTVDAGATSYTIYNRMYADVVRRSDGGYERLTTGSRSGTSAPNAKSKSPDLTRVRSPTMCPVGVWPISA